MDYVGRVVASGRWKNEWPWCSLFDIRRVSWRSRTLLEHSPLNPLPPSLTYTNATPPFPIITPYISIQTNLSHLHNPPLSLKPTTISLTQPVSLHYHHRQISTEYTSTNQTTLPSALTHLLTDPPRLNLFTPPLDHKSLSHRSLIPFTSTFSNYPNAHLRPISTHSL